MNCPHCGIFNLPHVVSCVKCGTALYTVLPDGFKPEPPRARHKRYLRHLFYRWRRHRGFSLNDGVAYTGVSSSVRKAVERVLPGKPAFVGARSRSSAAIRQSIDDSLDWFKEFPYLLLLFFLMGLVLPGLPQLFLNRPVRGRLLLIIYLVALLGMFICFGHWLFVWFVTAATLCQTISACDIANRAGRSFWVRLAGNLIISVIIFFVLGIAWQYCGNFYLRSYGEVFQATAYLRVPGIIPGDIVQGKRQQEYHIGDLVSFTSYSAVGEHGGYRTQMSFDRILATPGQKVEVRNNQIFINGNLSPSTVRPLNPDYSIPDMKLTLGKNQYFLCPSNYIRPIARVELQQIMHVVEENRVSYRLDRVIFPWWRRHLLTAEIK